MISMLGLHCPHVEGCAITPTQEPRGGQLLLPTQSVSMHLDSTNYRL